MQMNEIRIYDPEDKPFGNVQYFCDSKGRDWYDNNGLFKKKYVVQYNSSGVVKAVVLSHLAERLHPAGTSISEINSLPEDFSLSSAIWLFDGKKLTKTYFDPSVPTSHRKVQANKTLSSKIEPLRDAVELGVATEEERERYELLRTLRVRLMRIDDDTPPTDIDWGEYRNV